MSIWQKIKAFFSRKPKAQEPEEPPPKPKKPAPVPRPEPVPEELPHIPAAAKDWRSLPEGSLEFYLAAWKACAFDKGMEAAVMQNAMTVARGKTRYENVEARTGVPWWVIGCLHFKEGSCDFRAVLHNGEHIIGTGRKTTLVPKGRGPFSTWEEAAVDALGERWTKNTDWRIQNILRLAEKYNGTGYITGAGKAEFSPYLWARTNINDDFGKYVSDGKFDATQTTQKTSGVAAIAKALVVLGHAKVME